jgi:hypothetical protein
MMNEEQAGKYEKSQSRTLATNPDRDYFVSAVRYLDAVLFQCLIGFSLTFYNQN